jgi:hypothetical protein
MDHVYKKELDRKVAEDQDFVRSWGNKIRISSSSQAYKDGWERIFGNKQKPMANADGGLNR